MSKRLTQTGKEGPIRVAIVQEYVPKYRQAFFEGLIELLSSENIECRVFAGAPNQSQARRNDALQSAFIQTVRQREFSILNKRLVVSDVLQQTSEYDLIIFEQARRNLALYGLIIKRRLSPALRRNQTLALWGHGRDYANKSDSFTKKLMTVLTKQVDWFFGYTPESISHVVGEGFDRRKTTVVENSIDTRGLISAIKEAGAANTNNGPTRNISYIGALDSSKKIPMLLRCAQQIFDRDQQIRLTILGDGDERLMVEEFCATRPWVRYLGHSSGMEKAKVLAQSELLLNPGRIGLIALDSLASGVPIATTAFEYHAPEFAYLAADITCAVFPEDETAYAEGVAKLLRNNVALNNMQQRCLSLRDRYSIENMTENYAVGIRQALTWKRDHG